jgi:hypothetical protein
LRQLAAGYLQMNLINCHPEPCFSAKNLSGNGSSPCSRGLFYDTRERVIDSMEKLSSQRGPSPKITAHDDSAWRVHRITKRLGIYRLCSYFAPGLLALTLSLPAFSQSIGQVYASDAAVKGTVRETAGGLDVSNGSVITAGESSATLRLARGGQVRICPHTNLTVNSSPKGQELMFAMSAGAFEGKYELPATADAILTPDFRILISGPAKVDVAVTAGENGDACVRSVGDDSYVVVSELMGNDFYRVKPNEQVLFHHGETKNPELNSGIACGCPVPLAPAVQRAEASAPQTPVSTPEQRSAAIQALEKVPEVAATANAAAALPQEPKGRLQIQVDAPMIYQANGTAPDVTATLARVHVERVPWPAVPQVVPQPPSRVVKTKANAPAPEKKGFFHRLAKVLFG